MSNGTPTPIKGFRTAPKPTKGQVMAENDTLIKQIQQRLQGMQQFFGNLIQQTMQKTRTHEQELTQVSMWLGSSPTSDAAQKGDNLLMDYAGCMLQDDGTPATVKITDGEGKEVEIPDYFDGGSGKLFMLTNLVGGTLIPGYEEQLVGLKAGEGKEVIVQFPKEYGVKSLQEKKARFTVYIHEVRRPFANSPVGDLIDENERIRKEYQAREVAKAQAEAKAKAEATAAENPNKGPGADSVGSGEAQEDAPAPAEASAETPTT